MPAGVTLVLGRSPFGISISGWPRLPPFMRPLLLVHLWLKRAGVDTRSLKRRFKGAPGPGSCLMHLGAAARSLC